MKKVEMKKMCLSELLDLDLHIPAYQRIYCWNATNLKPLLANLSTIKGEHMLGTIVLHQIGKNTFDIVDGQQRIVSLALILQHLGWTDSSIFDQSFNSPLSEKRISDNKYIIQDYFERRGHCVEASLLLSNLTFEVIILNADSLNLAYTFFSNVNSKGKPLSDFDLLKAHHLRFIYSEKQAAHLATEWDGMLHNPKSNYSKVAEHLFVIRRWMRNEDWNTDDKYLIKQEFSAADIFEEIPPFAEKFKATEPIQGGSHFFGYYDHFVRAYSNFRDELMVDVEDSVSKRGRKPVFSPTVVDNKIYLFDYPYHQPFISIIETLSFAYYIKFGAIYLAEAVALIARAVSSVRYRTSQFSKERVYSDCARLNIVQAIDRATSPTFFLKDVANLIDKLPLYKNELGKIQNKANKKKGYVLERYHAVVQEMVLKIEPLMTVKEIKENYVEQK